MANDRQTPIKPMPFPGESPTVALAMAAGQKYGLHDEEKPAKRSRKAGSSKKAGAGGRGAATRKSASTRQKPARTGAVKAKSGARKAASKSRTR